eukprot:TRINITY_DN70656_c0_g1_i1.p1 TRINITY_DN70656_c0_g1~~TRINITY_DN70656_c0_g1_i1.p1  ORF type:complete len:132 (-),score=39.28 TRINITY_DN70656_c0_g1_i1:158-553(-)
MCIFCMIIKGDIPCDKVAETEHALAFMDIGPLSLGHIVVVPKEHSEFMHEVSVEALSDIMKLCKQIGSALGTPYNVLNNNGKIAGQEVPHVHFHVIPKRSKEEGLKGRWEVNKEITAEQRKEFCEKIKASL